MPNKSLGQHWLKDPAILSGIADCAAISSDETILEIGPGLGTLTSVLLARAQRVVAVEYDAVVAGKLPGQFPGKDLIVVNADCLHYDLSALPQGYKVVANVPYYITTKIMQKLIRAENSPERIVVLIQQEVAEKLSGQSGVMTPLSLELQIDYDIQLGIRVPKMYFTPLPKVDSQVLVCIKRDVSKIAHNQKSDLLRLIQAGFSAPRKKLRSSLAGGLSLSKQQVEQLLGSAHVTPDHRAQDLSLEQWLRVKDRWFEQQ